MENSKYCTLQALSSDGTLPEEISRLMGLNGEVRCLTDEQATSIKEQLALMYPSNLHDTADVKAYSRALIPTAAGVWALAVDQPCNRCTNTSCEQKLAE
jgi:hypothetical protein